MSDIFKQFENETYRVTIFYDHNAESPREWDNIGTMVCWHRRYNLGDKHSYNEPRDFLLDLAQQANEGCDRCANGDCDMFDELGLDDLLTLVKQKFIILPLYLYDHSGITMSTSDFGDRWDSGQVGWIYASKEKFINETGYTEMELFSKDSHRKPNLGERVKIKGRDFGQVKSIENEMVTVDFDYNKALNFRKPDNIVTVPLKDIIEVLADRAVEMLKDEVKEYDNYLRGNCFGYKVEEKIKCEECGHIEYNEIDSCWGYIGDDLKESGILDSLPEWCADLFRGGQLYV